MTISDRMMRCSSEFWHTTAGPALSTNPAFTGYSNPATATSSNPTPRTAATKANSISSYTSGGLWNLWYYSRNNLICASNYHASTPPVAAEIFSKINGATSSRGRSACNITTWQILFLFVQPFIAALSALFESGGYAGE